MGPITGLEAQQSFVTLSVNRLVDWFVG